MKKIYILASCLFCSAAASAQVLTTEGGLTIGSGATLTVKGDVQLKPGGSISNNGTLQMSGNWENNSGSSALTGSGTVRLDGSSPQSIGGSQPTQFHLLDLSTATGPVTLQQQATIGSSGSLSLGAANLLLNSNVLQVDNPSATAVTATTGQLVGETGPSPGYGTIGWRIGSGTGTYSFRSGTGSEELPLTMQITSAGAGAGGNIRYSTYPTNAANLPLPTGATIQAGHEPVTLDRFWIVQADNYSTAPTSTLRLSYQDSEWQGQGIGNENDLRIFRWNGTSWTGPYTTGVNSVDNYLVVNGITEYGIFAASSAMVLGCGGMAGTYTINSAQPSGGMNFSSFADAAAALNMSGLCGPVVLDVVPGSGPYTGQFLLDELIGSSSENTLTVNGNGEVLSHCGISGPNRDLVRLNGTDWVTISNLHLSSPCGRGWGIHLMNSAENVVLSGNTISFGTGTRSGIGIVAANSLDNAAEVGTAAANVQVLGNSISWGYSGMQFSGDAGSPATGLVAEDNVVNNAFMYGMHVSSYNAPVLNRNQVSMASGNTRSMAVVLNRVENGLTLTGNRVTNAGERGIWLNNINTGSSTRGLVANNMIGGGFQNAASASGLVLNNASALDLYHNSVLVDNTDAGRALHVTGRSSATLNVLNNSFAYTGSGSGYAMVMYSSDSHLLLDHNNYHSTGPNWVYFGGTAYSSMQDLRMASGLPHDSSSVRTNPMHQGLTNLLLLPGSALAGAGTPTSVTSDYLGAPRSLSSPTIGAHELPVPTSRLNTSGATAAGGVLVYPNPFHTELTVQLQNPGNAAVRLILTDVTGRQIYNQAVAPEATAIRLRVGEELPQGVYLLQVQQGDAATWHTLLKK